jgi:hypothetical protein
MSESKANHQRAKAPAPTPAPAPALAPAKAPPASGGPPATSKEAAPKPWGVGIGSLGTAKARQGQRPADEVAAPAPAPPPPPPPPAPAKEEKPTQNGGIEGNGGVRGGYAPGPGHVKQDHEFRVRNLFWEPGSDQGTEYNTTWLSEKLRKDFLLKRVRIPGLPHKPRNAMSAREREVFEETTCISTGDYAPPIVTRFEDFHAVYDEEGVCTQRGLRPPLAAAIRALHFDSLSEVQSVAIEPFIQCYSVAVQGQSGQGKTLAYLVRDGAPPVDHS